MFETLLPQTITNNYRGSAIAKWVFVAMTVLTVARSLAHIFLPDGGAAVIVRYGLWEQGFKHLNGVPLRCFGNYV